MRWEHENKLWLTNTSISVTVVTVGSSCTRVGDGSSVTLGRSVMELSVTCGVGSVTWPVHHRVEPVVLVSGVLHHAHGTVGFHYGVLTLHYISMTGFMLGLLVSGMGIFYAIFKLVVSGCLKIINDILTYGEIEIFNQRYFFFKCVLIN